MKLDDDDFALFALPRRFALERADLDAHWRRLQAEVHPDRFASQGAAAQRVAMQWAVRVNEAYRRLKDPLARGAYLCELRGHPVDAHSNTAMPPAFLMQQMEWREALEDAHGADAIRHLDDAVAAHERGQLEQLRRQLDELDDVPGAAQTVRSLMFHAKFRHDIDRRLEALDS